MRKGNIIGLMVLLVTLGATAGGLAAAGSATGGSQQLAVRAAGGLFASAADDPCKEFPKTLQSAGDGKTTWSTSSSSGTAVVVSPPNKYWAVPLAPSSSWVSVAPSGFGFQTTVYRTSFNVTQYTLNFATLSLSGSFLSDNSATASFNGTQLAAQPVNASGPVSNFEGPATPIPATTGGFQLSDNLDFTVTDLQDGGVTGLDYSVTVTCAPKYPDLAIVKTASSTQWTVGVSNTFQTVVTNGGPGTVPTGAVITVTDPLPTGLTYVNATGSGWTGCPSCSYTVPAPGLTTGQSPPPITWTVKPTVPGALTNCAVTAGQTGGSTLPEANDQNNKSCVGIRVVAGQPPTLDHFKCYVPKQSILAKVSGSVQLQDEFDGSKYEQVKVTKLFRFCNPVEKVFKGRLTPIRNPLLHLAFYSISAQPKTNRVIVATNQFGRQKVLVGPPHWLGVPTSKNSKTPPDTTRLNHFKCYPVLGGRPINVIVNLKDQWHVERQVRVVQPVIFCNPAVKLHAKKKYPIVNKVAHLLCYKVSAKPFSKSASILNQFNQTNLTVVGADILCVPSTTKLLKTLLETTPAERTIGHPKNCNDPNNPPTPSGPYWGGINDQFSTLNGSEPATPPLGGPGLNQQSYFDQTQIDKNFWHEFSDANPQVDPWQLLPNAVFYCKITLVIHVKPVGFGSENDAITLLSGFNWQDGWVQYIGKPATQQQPVCCPLPRYFAQSNSQSNPLLPLVWAVPQNHTFTWTWTATNPGTLPPGLTGNVNYDATGSNVFEGLQFNHHLDIAIEDDTSVDYVSLVVYWVP